MWLKGKTMVTWQKENRPKKTQKNPHTQMVSLYGVQDTVSTDEEDDEINADHHSRGCWTAIRHDPIVHHRIPVFSCQNLVHAGAKWYTQQKLNVTFVQL